MSGAPLSVAPMNVAIRAIRAAKALNPLNWIVVRGTAYERNEINELSPTGLGCCLPIRIDAHSGMVSAGRPWGATPRNKGVSSRMLSPDDSAPARAPSEIVGRRERR